MARSRNIKPSFFKNEVLAGCSALSRLLFAGLWTIADRDGRLEDRPKRIAAEILPYDGCDINPLLEDLKNAGFIQRYEVENNKYIQIVNFTKHQKPHLKEPPSEIPSPDKTRSSTGNSESSSALTLNPYPESPIPHPESLNPESGVAFRKIYDFGVDLFPALASRNTSEITKWVNSGAIPESDVYPAIRQAAGKDIKSWLYFSAAIMDAKASRERPLPEGKSKPQKPKSNYRSLLEASAEVAAKFERESL